MCELTAASGVFVFSLLYVAALCAIDISGTFVGFGDVVLRHLISFGATKFFASNITYGVLAVFSALLIPIIFYLAGVLSHKKLRWGALSITILVAVAASCLMAYRFIFSPYAAFMAVFIVFNGALRTLFLKKLENRIYFRAVTVGLILALLPVAITWAISLIQGRVWEFTTRVKYHQRVMCEEGTQSFEQLLNIAATDSTFKVPLPICKEALMVYLSPFIFMCSTAIFMGLFVYLYKSEKLRQEAGEEANIEPQARIFFGLVMLTIFALWISASISSLTKELASSVLWISSVVFVALFGVWLTIFGVQNFVVQLKATSLGKKGIEFLSSDWGKSLILFTTLPVLIFGTGLHKLKKLIHGERAPPESTETEGTNEHKLENWEYGSVLTKALVWGMVYFLVSVGVPRIIVVFLSALRGWLAGVHLAGISGILVGVGLLLFLLPPVPGVPVYAICGVVIPNLESSVFGFWWGIVYACVLSFVLKLLAIVVQQKIIGQIWGSKSVAVRSLVGINSVEIRATRKILSQPGLKLSKVVILCAGPDWPTSVLTGIMRLNLFQMLLGSLPVIVLIIPVVLSGAFVVRSSENELYSSVSSISIVFTVILSSISLLWAAKVIADTAVKYEEELRNEEPDREVEEREKLTEHREREYRYLTAWCNLGILWRIGHVLSIVLMVSSSYAFIFVGGFLFETFEIQDNLTEKLGGNVLNIVKTPGWVALATFAVATIYFFVFTQVFHRRKAPEGAVEPSTIEV